MTYPSHTLHTITDEQNLPFDPGEYSKFKHGSKRIARQFGHDLFHSFMPLLVDYIQQHGPKEIVLLSSPYEHIPTASHALRDYFMQRLNVFLSVNKLPLALDSKFYRYQQYSDDFSAMNVEERRQALLQDFYYVDREFFENRLLLCIDDVRITGTHERQIQSIFTQQEITSDAFFLYFATLSNPAIGPALESKLNQSRIQTLTDLHDIIVADDFSLNSRTAKFILQAPEGELRSFIERCMSQREESLLYHIYYASIGNRYNSFSAFQRNLDILGSYLDLNLDKLKRL